MPDTRDLKAPPDALIDAIGDAFRGVVYPGSDRIVSGHSGYDPERDQIERLLGGRHWRDVSFDVLDKLRTSLPFLSPEGFRFYLPAFMIYCLTDFYRSDVASDNVVSSLTLPRVVDFEQIRKNMDDYRAGHPEDADWLPDDVYKSIMTSQEEFYYSGANERFVLERISGFTAEQGRVIRRFLEYMRDVYGNEFLHDEPQIAIDRYWCRF